MQRNPWSTFHRCEQLNPLHAVHAQLCVDALLPFCIAAYHGSPDAQVSAGPSVDEIGSKLTPIKSRREFESLLASGKPVMVDFYAPW
jgi:thiol:disulfide interchange protein